MKKRIYVVGFPKSGNTWLTRLLADVLNCPSTGIFTDYEMAAEGHDRISNFIVVKTHHSVGAAPNELLQSASVVYIIRDIRDVLVSGFFHNHRALPEDYVTLNADRRRRLPRIYFRHEIRRMSNGWGGPYHIAVVNRVRNILRFMCGRPLSPTFKIGDWSQHAGGWANHRITPHIIRYEDLLSNGEEELVRLLSRMGMEIPINKIRESLERQSFSRRRIDFEQSGELSKAKFLRRGQTGDWKRFLDKRTLEYILSKHGKTLNKHGYSASL